MEIELSIVIAVVGCIVGVLGWLRNRDDDSSKRSATMTRMETKIDNIIEVTHDIKNEMSSLKKDVKELDTRQTKTEVKLETMQKEWNTIKGGR